MGQRRVAAGGFPLPAAQGLPVRAVGAGALQQHRRQQFTGIARARCAAALAEQGLEHSAGSVIGIGEVAGGELDRLSRIVDKNPPVLEQRDRFGRDFDRIEYHPAYHQMEKIGFEDFQIHSLCHR